MALIRCEASEGPRSGCKAVGVPSVEGHTEYLVVEDRFLIERDGERYLAVGVVGKDYRQGLTLVQLPFEADSGANRVWVRADDVVAELDEVPV